MLRKLTSIFSILDKPAATSVELRQALDGLDIPGAERAVDDLEARRQSLLLKSGSDADIESIEAEIRSGNREIERRHAAKREMERLFTEAETREKLADIEATAAKARDAQGRMMSNYAEIDGLATRLAELLDAIDVDAREIQKSNQFVIDNDRRDLKVNHPLGILAEHVGVTVAQLPAVHSWSLAGYRGPTVVRDEWRLRRFAELLPRSAARKAA